MSDLLNVYSNNGIGGDGNDPFDPQDVLTDEERALLRQQTPILDEILAGEQEFIDQMWAAICGGDVEENEDDQ